MTKLQANIIKLYNAGHDRASIASELGCNYVTVCKAIKQHGDIVEQNKQVKDINIDNWETDLATSLRKLTLHLSNILATKNLQKESSPQLIKTLAIAFDKLRLIEGKATNITDTNVSNLTSEQKQLYKELIDRYHAETRAKLRRVK
jgi:hypothetical protein